MCYQRVLTFRQTKQDQTLNKSYRESISLSSVIQETQSKSQKKTCFSLKLECGAGHVPGPIPLSRRAHWGMWQ